MWFVYVLRCSDETLYCGITTDVDRRLSEHNSSNKGARYTRSRRPCTVEHFWPVENRSQALKQEWAFKRLGRDKKLLILETKDVSSLLDKKTL